MRQRRTSEFARERSDPSPNGRHAADNTYRTTIRIAPLFPHDSLTPLFITTFARLATAQFIKQPTNCAVAATHLSAWKQQKTTHDHPLLYRFDREALQLVERVRGPRSTHAIRTTLVRDTVSAPCAICREDETTPQHSVMCTNENYRKT